MLKKITNINNIITRNEQALLMDRERNVPHFVRNSKKGLLLPWSRVTPLIGGATQIRLDGEIVDCVQVGVTNVKFAVSDGRVKEFSCTVTNVCEQSLVVSHSCASNGGELSRWPLRGQRDYRAYSTRGEKIKMTCPAMQVAKGVLEHNLPNAHVMEQMKDYCLRTRIASVRFGTLLDDPVRGVLLFERCCSSAKRENLSFIILHLLSFIILHLLSFIILHLLTYSLSSSFTYSLSSCVTHNTHTVSFSHITHTFTHKNATRILRNTNALEHRYSFPRFMMRYVILSIVKLRTTRCWGRESITHTHTHTHSNINRRYQNVLCFKPRILNVNL